MSVVPNLTALPADLPVPVDDGAADHLKGRPMPDVALPSTAGGRQSLRALDGPSAVVFIYPMTGTPGVPLPDGWDGIPGARGCTPQACGFRDLSADFREADTAVYGLSTQTPEAQAEAAARLHLPFPLLSDADLVLADALSLPRFAAGGETRLARLTLIVRDGRIAKHFYPVFPPNESAAVALDWLKAHPAA